jgi:hypothetical protein
MAFSAPAATNVFIHRALAQELTIGFARRPDKFSLNRWTQRKSVDKIAGYYLKINPSENARVLHEDARDKLWPSRQRRPRRPDNTPLHEWQPYQTLRYSEGYVIDHREREQADFDLSKAHSRMAMQQVMTSVTQLCTTMLSAADFTGNTDDVATLVDDPAGFFDTGTPENPYLLKAILAARSQIGLRTYGMLRGEDLVLLMNPNAARKIAVSEEMFAIRKESQHSLPLIKGDKAQIDTWGLTPRVHNHEVVIEDAVKDTGPKHGTEAPEYILGDDEVYLVSRPGGIDGEEGFTAHSTITIFQYVGGSKDFGGEGDAPAEFSIEELDLPFDRITEGGVTWEIDPQLTSARSAFKFTNCFEPASSE